MASPCSRAPPPPPAATIRSSRWDPTCGQNGVRSHSQPEIGRHRPRDRASLPYLDSAPVVRVFPPLEAMAVTRKSKVGEAGRKVLIARADARAARLAPIVAELRRGGVTSWYGIARALNKRGVPTASGRGIWEPAQVRRVMERQSALEARPGRTPDDHVRPEPDGVASPPRPCS
jgi:hypothetical protein